MFSVKLLIRPSQGGVVPGFTLRSSYTCCVSLYFMYKNVPEVLKKNCKTFYLVAHSDNLCVGIIILYAQEIKKK